MSGLLFKEVAITVTFRPGRFLIRRGFKIYPAFWVMIACTYAWALALGNTIPISNLLGELFYFQNYGFKLCWHTWSLAVEEHFYFLLAGFFFVLKCREGPHGRINFNVIPDAFRVVAVACLLLRFVTWAVILSPDNQNTIWFLQADHAVIDSLFFGVMLSHFWQTYGMSA